MFYKSAYVTSIKNILSVIYKEFGLKKDSSAGSIVDIVKRQIVKDKQFRNKVERIKNLISKS